MNEAPEAPQMDVAPAVTPDQAPQKLNYSDEAPDGAPVGEAVPGAEAPPIVESAPAPPDMMRPRGVELPPEEVASVGQIAIDAQVEALAPQAETSPAPAIPEQEKHGFLSLFHRKK